MPTATRTFRIFVSSTFEDLKAERNALQEKVFPELVKLCSEKGVRFQAIDLRWGVREEAGLDQKTMEICLAEIARCQKTGIKPNFIVLLGDRYGWRPLPARITKDEFETLLAHVTAEERKLLVFEEDRAAENNGWYRLDWNTDPPEYLLRPRDGEYKERSRWDPVEGRIREALQRAARMAGLTAKALIKYEASATHQEILAGLGTESKDREHVFAFLRNADAPKDPELKRLVEDLRQALPEGNVFPFAEGDLQALCQQVTGNLKKVIEAEASRFQSQSALEQEKEAHWAFAHDRSKHFVGRGAVREAIKDYLKSNDPRPLVVHGPSGSGKSSIIAWASEDQKGIRRFIGATPEASNGLTLLRSLCEEIGERYGQAGDPPATFNELVVMFQDRIRLATAVRPLNLYVDALDQLSAQDPAMTMNWLPRELPPHCRVVFSTIDMPPALANARLVPVERFSVEEAGETLDLWLKDAKRTLQKPQRQKLLENFRQTGLPLYLKLAFEEARLWRSFDPIDKCLLGDGLPGIIDRLFARLSEPGNHGEVLVSHALGFLAAARYGLTEDEMLDVLAANDAVWKDFEGARRHDLPGGVKRLPVIVWSRLYLDLEPYLTERAVPGGTTISFYHRQLVERVSEVKAYHSELARHFGQHSNWRAPQLANERRGTELVRQKVGAELLDEVVGVLTDLDFVSAKCAASLVLDLQEDYREAIAALPEAQAELREEERRKAELASWNQTLIECAREKKLPKPEGIIRSVEPWSDERIEAECRRIIENPTWLDRVKAFAGFVEQEANSLNEFGRMEGFVAQHAFNSAPRGPAHAASAGQIGRNHASLLLRRWPENAIYNPKPALLRTLEGHSFGVTNVAVTPDGHRVVSASWELKVWDVETGRELRTLIGHSDWVKSVAVTPDRRHAVSASKDKTLKVWDLETGRELRTLVGHSSDVNSIAVTPDGRLAISASQDLTLKVWDLETGRELRTLAGHSGGVSGVTVTPDGRRAVSGSSDKTIKVWDLETGRELRTLAGHSDWVMSVALTPDGRHAVSASNDYSLKVWNVETYRELRTLEGHSGGVSGVARPRTDVALFRHLTTPH